MSSRKPVERSAPVQEDIGEGSGSQGWMEHQIDTGSNGDAFELSDTTEERKDGADAGRVSLASNIYLESISASVEVTTHDNGSDRAKDVDKKVESQTAHDHIDIFSPLPDLLSNIGSLCALYRKTGDIVALEQARTECNGLFISNTNISSNRRGNEPSDLETTTFLLTWMNLESYDMHGDEHDLRTSLELCTELAKSDSDSASTLHKMRVRLCSLGLLCAYAHPLNPPPLPGFLADDYVLPRDESPDTIESPHLLQVIGKACLLRFETKGEPLQLGPLNEAITFLERARDGFPDRNAERAASLCLMARALIRHRECCPSSQQEDLQRALSCAEEAHTLIQQGNPRHSRALQDYASVLRLLDTEDALNRAITMSKEASKLHRRKDGKDDSILAKLYVDRYKRRGRMSDLDESIRLLQAARAENGKTTVTFMSISYDLSLGLRERFYKKALPEDIDSAIAILLEVKDATPRSAPVLTSTPLALAQSYCERYSHFHRPTDLQHGLKYAKEDWGTRGDGASCLRLGEIYFMMFEQDRNKEENLRLATDWLDRAGSQLESVGDIIYYEVSLGQILTASCRLKNGSVATDWDEALNILKRAYSRVGREHRRCRAVAWRLADALASRAYQCSIPKEFFEAMSVLQPWLQEPVEPDIWWTKCMTLYASCSARLAGMQEGLKSSLYVALSVFESAVCSSRGTAYDRFEGARMWAAAAYAHGKTALALRALKAAVKLLPEIGSNGLEAELRLQELGANGVVSRDAAALAIQMGALEDAIELLESGRTLFWTEMIATQMLDDEIMTRVPAAWAHRLQEITKELRGAITQTPDLLCEASIQKQRALSEERKRIVSEIREQDGMQDFLRPLNYSSLRTAAKGGPVVILNSSHFGCDILIVTGDLPVRRFPLPDVRLDWIRHLYKEADEALQTSMKDKKLDVWNKALEVLLGQVWDQLTAFVVKELRELYPDDFPGRVWLCPTGPFSLLPLHVACDANGEAESLLDITACSYTPCLTSLLHSIHHTSDAPLTPQDPSVLLIGQPSGRQNSHLLHVEAELAAIESAMEDRRGSLIKLLGPTATVQKVCTELQRADWVHFSGHTAVDRARPLNTHLCLSDGNLPLSQLAEMNLSSCKFAFFSSCSSASAAPAFLEEAMSMGSALHVLGVPSVVGTLFPIPDKAMPEISSSFYVNFDSSESPPCSAAEAIRIAVLAMREQGKPLAYWVPLVHIGV